MPLADQVTQRAPGHQLHHQEHVVAGGVVDALVVHRDGVDVGEARRSAGLAREPVAERGIGRERGGHHLHGDTAIEPLVDGRVDDRHPAARDAIENAVAALEQAADQRVCGRRLHTGILRAGGAGPGVGSAAAAVFSGGVGSGVDSGEGIGTSDPAFRSGEVELLADADRPGGWLLLTDRIRQSYVDLDDPTYLDFEYVQAFADVIELLPDGPLTMTHVGGAGCTLARYVAARRPGSTADRARTGRGADRGRAGAAAVRRAAPASGSGRWTAGPGWPRCAPRAPT